ncbi:MAG: hypothetical protein AB7V39_04430 [Nitrospiraceae bacterium]
MPGIIRTYFVVSATPVVIENPIYGTTTNYSPGAVFNELDSNVSVVRLLAAQKIVEVPGSSPVDGYITVRGDTGPTGPIGPTGPLAPTLGLSTTLGIGNDTGANDIVITTGQQIGGGRAAFGGSTSAVIDGDVSAGNGTQDFYWNTASERIQVTGTINDRAGLRVTNTSNGALAASEVQLLNELGNSARLTMTSSNFAPAVGAIDANWVTLSSSASAAGLRLAADGAQSVEIWTNGSVHWRVASDGTLLPATDNSKDIGITGTNRVRNVFVGTTVFVGTSVEIGSVLGATATGDIRAGDGVNELYWNAAAGRLTIPNLHVSGTQTILNTQLQSADRYILLNSDSGGDTPQTSGLVMNVDPAATSFAISSIVTNIVTVVAGDPSAVLSAGDFVLIQGPADDRNAGIFEVMSTTTSTITIDTVPTEAFSGNTLYNDVTVQGTILGIGVTGIRANTGGALEQAYGTAAPLTWGVLGGLPEVDKVVVSYDTTGLAVGDCVRITSTATVGQTDASADTTADFIGVVYVVGGLGTGKVITDGLAQVRFDAGLTPSATEPVFLSETGGLATNVEPTVAGSVSYQIGYIRDVLTYSGVAGDLMEVQLRFGGRIVNGI